MRLVRAALISFAIAIVGAWAIYAHASQIEGFRTGYVVGTALADDPDYAALYAQTSDRTLMLYAITEQGDRTAAIYELGYRHAGGEYRETGVLVLYHDPVRLEFVPVENLDPTAMDLAVAGQAADIGTTAAALSSGLVEGNPVVAGAISTPAAAAALIALKLGAPALAGHLSLSNCTATRTALASFGWGAAAWNVAAITGAASGVGGLVAIIAGWLAADAAEKAAPIRCAGLTQPGGPQ